MKSKLIVFRRDRGQRDRRKNGRISLPQANYGCSEQKGANQVTHLSFAYLSETEVDSLLTEELRNESEINEVFLEQSVLRILTWKM